MARLPVVSYGFLILALASVAAAQPALPPCPTGVTATANPDGSITVSWDAVPGADGYNLFRDHHPLADPADLIFAGHVTDTDASGGPTEVGVTYTFQVTATQGELQSADCPTVQATAVPEFPTLAAMGIALGLGLVAYRAARR